MKATALAALLLLSIHAASAADKPPFQAGAVAIDISPTTFPRIIAGGFLEGRGDRVVSKLHSRAIVLDDGKTQIAFAIVDTCMMEQKLIDEAKALASKQCGIPVDRMMVSATHTHSAPAAMGCLGTRQDPEYAKFLIPKIAESIVTAHQRLQPARIGWSSIDDWEHTHNRRWIRLAGKEVVDPFGQPTGRANMHPGYLSKDVVGPSGPVDPQLSVISIQTQGGKPLAVLANYSMHYFGQGPVSADYYGLFCDAVAQRLQAGPEFVCAMSQGTSGDLMWMDYGAAKKELTVQSYSEAVADYAMKALGQVKHQDHATLGMVEKTLELKYRVPDEKRLAWARPIAAKIESDVPKTKEEVYAREALILHERQRTSVKLQAIRIGDPDHGEIGITTLPNEVYAITGLRLKWASPFHHHFNIELANGAEGYIPPAEQHELGGYTTWPARTAGLEIGAEAKIREALVTMARELDLAPGRGMSEDAPPYTMAVIDSHASLFVDFRYATSDLYSIHSGAKTATVGPHAFDLPGFNAGRDYGGESALRYQPLRVQRDKINRSIHLAGGQIETTNLKLGDKASIALWFWLGHESGASERSGHLMDALGASLVAHQFADHTVRLEWGKVASALAESPSASSAKAEATFKGTFADDWHFAVLIREGDQLRVHLDGDEQPILTGKAGENTEKLIFGQGLQGRLDEITVWDRAIEPKLIAQLWQTSKVGEDNARHAIERTERAKKAAVQKEASLKQHGHWSVSMRFRSTKANNVSPVTAYLISRGPKGDHQAPGDHLGIGGNYKDSEPGKLFVFNGNAADNIVRGKTLIEPGSWNDVTLERMGSRVKVTLNGKVEIDAELPVTAAGATDLFFGRRCDDLAPLEGEFEKVVVAGLEAPKAAAPAPKPKLELTSLPLSPEQSMAKIHVREGYEVQLVAEEPVVLDPIAFDWDTKGNLWVVEMADYPLGMDGHGKAGGRVVKLSEPDAAGRYRKRTVFADGLTFPTGILVWREGIIVTAAPDILWLADNDGDGRAEVREVMFTGFSEGNQQLRVNGLRWGMDGWVYCAGGAHTGNYNKGTEVSCAKTGAKVSLGSRDFRFKPDTGEFEPQSGPSQYGRCRDDWGHWFGVQNSFPLWHYVLDDRYLRRNPHVIPPDPVQHLFTRNPRVYPASAAEKRFHSFDQSGRFTSACGIEVWRGDEGWAGVAGKMPAAPVTGGTPVPRVTGKMPVPQQVTGTVPVPLWAFTCEPFHNVVQRHRLSDDGVSFMAARDAEGEATDFFASEDRWCRPVMVRTGPDDALYIADMYRYMIEHPQWLPQDGKDELLPFYREGEDKGRIWRVVNSKFEARNSKGAGDGNGAKSNASGVRTSNFEFQASSALASPNGWLRDRAQRELLNLKRADHEEGVWPLLKHALPQVRAQAAWTLLLWYEADAAKAWSPDMTRNPWPAAFDKIILAALSDEAARVREQGLLMAERHPSLTVFEAAAALVADDDAKVRLQLACTLGEWQAPKAGEALAALLKQDADNPIILGAAMSSAMPHLTALAQAAVPATLTYLAPMAAKAGNDEALLLLTEPMFPDGLHTVDASLLPFHTFLTSLKQAGIDYRTFAKQKHSEDFSQRLALLDHFFDLALEWTANPAHEAIDPLTRIAEIPLLVDAATAKRGYEQLHRMLSSPSPSSQAAAIAVLARHPAKEAHGWLLERWDSATPATRLALLDALMADAAGVSQLLDAIKAGRVNARALDAQQQARLLNHPNKKIQAQAADTLASMAAISKRPEVLEKYQPALALQGDVVKGKAAFAINCAACHQLEGVGLPLGPDLRSVVQHDKDKLLHSILDPSAIIEPGFTAYHCTLKSGEQLYGIVATETSTSITLKLPGNLTRSLLRAEITELKSTNTSLMPDGLEAALTPQAVADVIAYLQVTKQ